MLSFVVLAVGGARSRSALSRATADLRYLFVMSSGLDSAP
jgi:hypothetical protein